MLVLGKALYGVLGYVIPDGTTPADQGDVHVTVNSTADPEVVAQAIAVHGRRRAEVRATHAPVDDA